MSFRFVPLFLALVSASLLTPRADAEDLYVSKVLAADLFEIQRDGEKELVRLYGVDAPETEQDFGKRARDYVGAKILNKTISMTERARDDKGLAVVDVTLGDVGSLALHLVQNGYAWWDDRNAKDEVELRKANAKSIVDGTGLWTNAAALTPWDYRRSHGLEDFSYTVEKEEAEPEMAQTEEEDRPRELSAKGDGRYPTPDPATFNLPKNAGVADYMGLATKMGVRFNDQGLTADNIMGLPYAAQLGFQNGDVVSGVNGMPLRNEMDALNLYNQLKGEKVLKVNVIRDGSPATITIDTTRF